MNRSLLRTVLCGALTVCASLPAHAQEPRSTLRGEVVLRHDDGIERAPVAGTMQLWFYGRDGWERRDVDLAGGRFATELPARTSWGDVGRLVLDGTDAWCAFGFDQGVPNDSVRLVARPARPFTLRVVDARSGRDFESFELLETGLMQSAWFVGERRGIAVKSPYNLPLWGDVSDSPDDLMQRGWLGTRTFTLRASGTAWSMITIDPSNGGTRTLTLQPEAILAVRLEDGDIPPDVRLQLRERPQDPHGRWIEIAHAGRAVEIDGLAAGRYWLVAEITEKRGVIPVSQATGRFLLREAVDLEPGDVREVRFTLLDRSQPVDAAGTAITNRRPLRGTLRVPAEWKADWLAIDLERYEMATRGYRSRLDLRDLRPDPADPTLLHWDAGVVEAGAWLAVLKPIPWNATFVVDPAQGDEIALVLPPPAEVSVRVVDAATQLDIEPCTLSWYALPPPQSSGIGGTEVERDPKTKRWQFRATQGEIVLMPYGYVYPATFERATIHAGENEITIALAKPFRITLEAYDGTSRIPAADVHAMASEIGGPGRSVTHAFDGSGSYVEVDRPGTYSVELNGIAGYEQPAAVVVEVGPGIATPTAIFRLLPASR